MHELFAVPQTPSPLCEFDDGWMKQLDAVIFGYSFIIIEKDTLD